MRFLLALAVALGLLVLTPSPSWACSCVAMTTAQRVAAAGTVASGTVDWTSTDGQTRTYQVDFDAVYKGAAAQAEKLRTNANGASCGLGQLATDKRYIFFVDGLHPGAMRVNSCLGAVAYDATVAAHLESLTGPPDDPIPLPRREPSTEDTVGRTVLVAAGGFGALALLSAVALAVRRRADLA